MADDWEFQDTLTGTYTGAEFTYKPNTKKKKTYKGYIGFKKKGAKGNRTLKITEQMSSLKDGKRKAAAQVNKSNEQAVTLSGTMTASGIEQKVEMHKCMRRLTAK